MGTMGDSFGILSSLFASLALLLTIITNDNQTKQISELSKDRQMQYYKQLYDLYFLDEKVSRAYYYFEHDMISFFEKPLLEGRHGYWEIRDIEISRVDLESSIDALLSTVDLTVRYINDGLIRHNEHFEYRLYNISSDVQILSYLKTLKIYNQKQAIPFSPFPNLYGYLEKNGLI
ncbi:hypothetical protein GCM10008960_09070 [Deinococcus sedimenti]|uniref:Uncharacterized protein n=2 Tax=Deinococcus sedimenti TaxID=1867090 RepID=A0ABQ2S047_9DEIO|nr:hypothetical protein GCM10008960_09070 [Deinococcus sedimenti]